MMRDAGINDRTMKGDGDVEIRDSLVTWQVTSNCGTPGFISDRTGRVFLFWVCPFESVVLCTTQFPAPI